MRISPRVGGQKYPLLFVHEVSQPDELVERYDRAWAVARQAAALLKSSFGAKKVAVFGSLVNRLWFSRWSDIDLAAWGIPHDCFYKAVAAVTDLSEEFKVDLVDPESCRPGLRERIEQEGIVL